MRLLLDTHVFLWYINGDKQLPAGWLAVLRDPTHQVFLSVVSVWEASLKYHLGKLPLPQSPAIYFPQQRQRHAIASLPLEEASLSHLVILPSLRRDPFDRILVCQALENGLTLVTADAALQAYPVPILAR